MRSLLLIAHGSRREAANREIRQLAQCVAERVGGVFDHVGHGFLELAEPDIPAAIDQAVRLGADEIVILPHFLATGRHVVEDIPAIVRHKRHEYPDVTLEVAPYLGAAPALADLLADWVQAAVPVRTV